MQELVPLAAYGIYWGIIEYLHENTLKVDELEKQIEEANKIVKEYDNLRQQLKNKMLESKVGLLLHVFTELRLK